jgi:hypothetical protein
VSITITRVATIALTHTGLSRETARFQARSAFTGVGFTTSEAEKVVGHPVRRRILMLLMLLGNAGIVTAVSSIVLTFVDSHGERNWLLKVVLLVAGVALLWTAAYSHWLDRHISHLVRKALKRWTDLDVRDYAGLLHLGGDYSVHELQVRDSDWMAGHTLAELGLREEGVMVLGVQRTDGEFLGAPTGRTKIRPNDTVLFYGRDKSLADLDKRGKDIGGKIAHVEAVSEQKRIEEQTDLTEQVREVKEQETEKARGRVKDSDTNGSGA